MLFIAIYSLQAVAVTLSVRARCQVSVASELIYFEADICLALILQLIIYRMLTLTIKISDDPGDLETLFQSQEDFELPEEEKTGSCISRVNIMRAMVRLQTWLLLCYFVLV